MAKFDTYRCDICGILKGSGNHWFRVVVDDEDSKQPFCAIYVWDGGQAGPLEKHLCSDACVIKLTQQWLTEQQVANMPKPG